MRGLHPTFNMTEDLHECNRCVSRQKRVNTHLVPKPQLQSPVKELFYDRIMHSSSFSKIHFSCSVTQYCTLSVVTGSRSRFSSHNNQSAAYSSAAMCAVTVSLSKTLSLFLSQVQVGESSDYINTTQPLNRWCRCNSKTGDAMQFLLTEFELLTVLNTRRV